MHVSSTGTLIVALYTVQLLLCLLLGYRTGRRPGRSRIDWTTIGFLLAILPPPFGVLASAAAWLWLPARPDATAPASR